MPFIKRMHINTSIYRKQATLAAHVQVHCSASVPAPVTFTTVAGRAGHRQKSMSVPNAASHTECITPTQNMK